MATADHLPCGCPRHASRSAGDYRLKRSLTLPHCTLGKHCHPEARIVFTLSGSFETSHGDRRLPGDGNAAVYRPAWDEHEDACPAPLDSIALLLSGEDRPRQPYVMQDPGLPGLAWALKSEWSICDTTSALVLEGLASLAASIVLHRRPVAARGRAHWITAVREQLDVSYSATPTLASLARSVDRETAYVAATFKRVYGTSIGLYLRELRLWKARSRMERDDASLAMIALDCGYSDQSHFTRQFRRLFRMTPAEYRQRHRLHGLASSPAA